MRSKKIVEGQPDQKNSKCQQGKSQFAVAQHPGKRKQGNGQSGSQIKSPKPANVENSVIQEAPDRVIRLEVIEFNIVELAHHLMIIGTLPPGFLPYEICCTGICASVD